jgi:hypothetical protein
MNEFVHLLQEASLNPTTFLIEFLPWLKHLPSPLNGWKRDAEEQFRHYSKMFGELYDEVKQRIVRNPLLPKNFLTKNLLLVF